MVCQVTCRWAHSTSCDLRLLGWIFGHIHPVHTLEMSVLKKFCFHCRHHFTPACRGNAMCSENHNWGLPSDANHTKLTCRLMEFPDDWAFVHVFRSVAWRIWVAYPCREWRKRRLLCKHRNGLDRFRSGHEKLSVISLVCFLIGSLNPQKMKRWGNSFIHLSIKKRLNNKHVYARRENRPH